LRRRYLRRRSVRECIRRSVREYIILLRRKINLLRRESGLGLFFLAYFQHDGRHFDNPIGAFLGVVVVDGVGRVRDQ
jgi:hypothetical protein